MLDRSANLFDDNAPTTDAPAGLSVDPADEDLGLDDSVDADTGGSRRAQPEDAVAISTAVDGLFDAAPSDDRPRSDVHRFGNRIAVSAPRLRRSSVVAAMVALLVVVLLVGVAAVLGVGDSPSTVPQRPGRGAVSRYPDPRTPQIPVVRPNEEQLLRAQLRVLRAQLRAERRRAAGLPRAARPEHHPTAVKRPKPPVAGTTVAPRTMRRPRAGVLSNRTAAELSVEG